MMLILKGAGPIPQEVKTVASLQSSAVWQRIVRWIGAYIVKEPRAFVLVYS
jgi:hypothetical protein